MPIKVNAGAVEITFDKVNAALTESDFVKVNAAQTIVFENALPEATQTFLPINSIGYRRSGGNYTGDQLAQRARLGYYGRSSSREEGAMFLMDHAAIAAFLASRPTVTQVEVHQLSQHTFSGSNSVSMQWHNSSPLPVDIQAGWPTPIGPAKIVSYPKSTTGIRVTGVWTGAEAQEIGDAFRLGNYKGLSVWLPGAAVERWGWSAGYAERSTGSSAGSPTGYTATGPADQVQLILSAQG